MRKARFLVALALTCASTAAQTCGGQGTLAGQPATTPAWMNPADATWTAAFAYTPANRAATLLNAMTLAQMEQQMAGVGGNFTLGDITGCGSAVRHLQGIPSLCIQTYRIANGPPGIGTGDCAVSPKATALPSDLALTASFDPPLALAYGNIIGAEARSVDVQVVEGPGMDMLRVPQGGRSFEYASEDPFLAGTMVSQIVEGEQSHGIIGMCKHFQGNEQETDRQTVSDIISEQSRNEIYYTPFRMCVKDGGALAVMCAYNLVGGVHQCQDPTSLTDALRKQWGFPGYVQSDFGATNATAPSILAGENMEMNSAVYFTPALLTAALEAGPAPLKPLPGWMPPYPVATGALPCGFKAGENPNCLTPLQLQTALLQRYTAMFTQGIFDRSLVNDNANNNVGAGPQVSAADGAAHGAMARAIADQSAVLLKNTGHMLPLQCSGGAQTIALIGPASLAAAAYTGGGGSSAVSPIYTVTPLAGLQAACPTATIKEYNVSSTSTLNTAVAAAATANIAIVIVGDEESEGIDRATIAMTPIPATANGTAGNGTPLPDTIVETVYAAQPNTVVVLVNGDPVTLPWANSVPAILEVFYPGEEYGDAMADLLFAVPNPTAYGPVVANPSGKSPMTFPVLATDVNAATTAEYPGIAETLPILAPPGYEGSSYYTGTYGGPAADLWVNYAEGLNIGYRWYDSQNITPQYCFGFGLSYSTFTLSNVATTPATDGTEPITVTATVTNTGSMYGAEVVQVYLGFPEGLGEPPRRLVGFQKIWLNAGQSGPVSIEIDPAATNYPLSTWDSRSHEWEIASGTYTVYVGNSSGLVGNSAGCTAFANTGNVVVGRENRSRMPIRHE